MGAFMEKRRSKKAATEAAIDTCHDDGDGIKDQIDDQPPIQQLDAHFPTTVLFTSLALRIHITDIAHRFQAGLRPRACRWSRS